MDVDDRAERCGSRARGGGCNDRCAEVEQLVGLHDDRVARSALFPSMRGARRWEPEHLAPDHRLRGGARREFGHLLPNDPHLLTIGIIGRETKRFLTQRRSRASARRCFAQCSPDSVGVAHA